MSRTLDKFYAYKFIYILTQPWEETDAYKHGIIDKDGTQLKKTYQLTTPEQKKSYTKFHKLVFNIKRMLQKVPFAQSTIGRYSTALAMIREEFGIDLSESLVEHLQEFNGVGGMDAGGRQSALPLNKRDDERSKKYAELLRRLQTRIDVEEDTGDDVFAGDAIFNCDSDTFQNCRLGKRKFLKYKTYVGEDEVGERIRKYGRKNPNKGIILKDSKTGAMLYLRRKKK